MENQKEVPTPAVDENRLMFDKEFDAILEKLATPEFSERGYAPGATVTIPASLFVEFNQFIGLLSKAFKGYTQTAESIIKSADHFSDEIYKFSLRFAKAHVANIEAGNTVPNKELDALDAEVKITEKKISKKKK